MYRILLSLLILLPALLRASPRPAPWFSDGAVLQQGRVVPVWGTAEPGERITVSFLGQEVSTTADSAGVWQVLLGPLETGGAPSDLCIQGSTTVTVRDVLVGEVWLCAGEGNMQSTVAQSENASEATAAQYPALRHAVLVPGADGEQPTLRWQSAGPATTPGFGAVSYFFARNIHRKTGLPVGVVTLAAGGSPIETWLSPSALGNNPSLSFVKQRWLEDQASHPARMQAYQQALIDWTKSEAKARLKGTANLNFFLKKHPRPVAPQLHLPGANFNTMISPLLPCAVRGVIWYQGESNAARPEEYDILLRTFITSTRSHLGAPRLPILLVQAGAFASHTDPSNLTWSKLRQVQQAAAALPEVGVVISLDLTETPNACPPNKAELARRLSQNAMHTIYSIDSEYLGPTPVSALVEGNSVKIDFAHAASGLIAYKKPVQSMELAGPDGVFHPASVVIKGSCLVLSSTAVRQPRAVRYAWSNAPYANLANGAGFPSAPFIIPDLLHLNNPDTTNRAP